MSSALRRRPRRVSTIPLDQYDPWPLRLVIGGLVLIALGGLVLLAFKEDVTGLIPIPLSVVTVLPMLLSRRPPWTARKDGEVN